MIACPNCLTNKANNHPRFGVLPCDDCNKRQESFLKPNSQIEFTTDEIKQSRGEFMDDIEQPHYKGHLNKKYVDIYGKQAARDRGFSEAEIENAKYVYNGSGIRYYDE